MNHLEQQDASTLSTFYWFNLSIVSFGISIWIILESPLSTFFPIAAVLLFIIGGAASLVKWLCHLNIWMQFQRKSVCVEGTVLKRSAELQSFDDGATGWPYQYYVVVEFLNGAELVRLRGRVKDSYYQSIRVGSSVGVRFAPSRPAFAQYKWDDQYRSVYSSSANDHSSWEIKENMTGE